MTAKKKIPRAIECTLVEELKKVHPEINEAIKLLLGKTSVNSRSNSQNEIKDLAEDDIKDLSGKLWKHLKPKVQAVTDLSIAEARRGY